ncbi:MAG: hypothetical protein HY722_08550 [Planctomycetes bacterium]|nr:hypothetical protein [Planctomycetota bacterium]
MGGLRRALRDEGGNAMAEMVVLLPVYLLLIVGAIYRGDLGLVAQRAEIAARYTAWQTAGGVNATPFFGNFRGLAREGSGGPATQVYTIGATILHLGRAQAYRGDPGRDGSEEYYVTAILDGRLGPGAWLEGRESQVDFQYTSYTAGSRNVMELPDATVSRAHTTLLKTPAHRTLGDPSRHDVEGVLFRDFLVYDLSRGLERGMFPEYLLPEPEDRNGAWERDFAATRQLRFGF